MMTYMWFTHVILGCYEDNLDKAYNQDRLSYLLFFLLESLLN